MHRSTHMGTRKMEDLIGHAKITIKDSGAKMEQIVVRLPANRGYETLSIVSPSLAYTIHTDMAGFFPTLLNVGCQSEDRGGFQYLEYSISSFKKVLRSRSTRGLASRLPPAPGPRFLALASPVPSASRVSSATLFYSFFKSLVGKDVVVELKNDLSICGTLHSVDQYLNIKLTDISVTDPEKYPHMLSVKNCFIRGSVVHYVQLPADEVDTQLLQDAARKEALQQKQ
uniref:uncharacterized protein LOC129510209 n=1 Tax=Nyctereutes procyonoides TaxID=34880 RepID=UPI002444CE01|nr:uncharacterized protein LOC129510209 [Nyctereutes procyonoides]